LPRFFGTFFMFVKKGVKMPILGPFLTKNDQKVTKSFGKFDKKRVKKGKFRVFLGQKNY